MGSLEDYLFLKESCFVLSKTKRLSMLLLTLLIFLLYQQGLIALKLKS